MANDMDANGKSVGRSLLHTAVGSVPTAIGDGVGEGRIPVTSAPTAGALTDKSGTITTGGTAQTAAALNASRKYLFIQNPPHGTGEPLVLHGGGGGGRLPEHRTGAGRGRARSVSRSCRGGATASASPRRRTSAGPSTRPCARPTGRRARPTPRRAGRSIARSPTRRSRQTGARRAGMSRRCPGSPPGRCSVTDNTTVQAGASFTVASDLIGGAAYQRVKVTYGADGAATDTSADAPFPAYDPQAVGWRDDGHEAGVGRYEQVNGDACRVALRQVQYYAEATGTAGVTYNTNAFTGNPDGSGTELAVSVPTGLGNGLRVWLPFSGRCFGVRWQAANTTPDFTVTVDGVAVAVEGWPSILTLEGITTQITHAEATLLTHDNLSRGAHLAEIVFSAPASGTSAWIFYGLLLDRGAGYEPATRVLHAATTVAQLTTSAVAIPLTASATERTLRGVARIIYTNITGTPQIVTIKNSSTVIWAKSVPANDVVVFDAGGTLAISSAWTHQCDANSAINATIIGGY